MKYQFRLSSLNFDLESWCDNRNGFLCVQTKSYVSKTQSNGSRARMTTAIIRKKIVLLMHQQIIDECVSIVYTADMCKITRTCVCVCVLARACVHVCVCACVCMYVCIRTCMHESVCVCVSVCV